eukprot:scaffold42340_cov17-Tisochrysis_lutea.AAC.3
MRPGLQLDANGRSNWMDNMHAQAAEAVAHEARAAAAAATAAAAEAEARASHAETRGIDPGPELLALQ